MRYLSIIVLISGLIIGSCSGDKEKSANTTDEKPARIVQVPPFNEDSAYFFVKTQVEFGPRIPNSPAHRKTAAYLAQKLSTYGATVTEQKFDASTFDGQRIFLNNIIASFYPDKQKRILLAAHWDTRPFADKDHDQPNAPFDGANDGASGVGVLLEIARIIQKSSPQVGVDIIFFDGEDWGERNGGQVPLRDNLQSWWCLGSQYWVKNKHKPNYSAYYGILLDMVGSHNAKFFREGNSLEYAPLIVEKVWNTAARLGYSHVFIKQNQGEITDDHVFINQAKIPMINIINYDPSAGGFGSFHHTKADNMSIISKETLGIVGDVVTNVIYYEE